MICSVRVIQRRFSGIHRRLKIPCFFRTSTLPTRAASVRLLHSNRRQVDGGVTRRVCLDAANGCAVYDLLTGFLTLLTRLRAETEPQSSAHGAVVTPATR